MPRSEPWKRSAISDGDGMSLPEGKSCGDCQHFPRCNAMYGHIALDEVCDWSPSRFVPVERLTEVDDA